MSFELTRQQMKLLAEASIEDKQRIVGKMTAADALDFDADFESWAHQAQLPPNEDGWRTWLMMAERLALPLLIPGQAQKEVFHNEALQVLDAIVVAAVEELPRNDPPPAPQAGSAYLVGETPTAEWSGYADHLAAYGIVGWRFFAPVIGLRALVKSTSTFAQYGSAGWEIGIVRASCVVVGEHQVIGARAGAINDPAGGTIVDAEVRFAVSEMLTALRQHGLISE